MAFAITQPHATEPGASQGAIEMGKHIESIMSLRNLEHYSIMGDKPKTMLDLSTSDARGTEYNNNLSFAIENSSMLIELQSYHFDNNKELAEYEFILGDIPNYTDDVILDTLFNTINDIGDCSVEIVEPSNHYAAVLSEFIFEKPAIILMVNDESIDKFMALSEYLVDFVVDYEASKASLVRA